jgi:hypothetical protein
MICYNEVWRNSQTGIGIGIYGWKMQNATDLRSRYGIIIRRKFYVLSCRRIFFSSLAIGWIKRKKFPSYFFGYFSKNKIISCLYLHVASCNGYNFLQFSSFISSLKWVWSGSEMMIRRQSFLAYFSYYANLHRIKNPLRFCFFGSFPILNYYSCK